MDAGANTGCSSGDCDDEEQEDPSSSSFHDEVDGHEAAAASLEHNEKQINSGEEDLFAFRKQWQRELEALAASSQEVKQDDATQTDGDDMGQAEEEAEAGARRGSEADAGEDELAVFRQQWRRELEASPAPTVPAAQLQDEPTTDIEKAKKLFLLGAELERGGKWYEAIQHYKRAMALIPDIERRIYESTKGTETPQEVAEEVEEVPVNTNTESDSEEEMVEGEEVVARLLRIHARKGLLICPLVHTKSTHISALPYEVLQAVLRWVVSAELDCGSLEAAGAACRALHLAARDHDLWRCVCVRTWGVECGTPRERGFASWRAMYVSRPRLLLHGCYISKTTYLRHGENSFQDQFYRPWYLIDYYRYLRFFPEGQVLMWTTAEEPATCVRELRWRTARPGTSILAGHYRLIGDKVVIVIKKGSDKKPAAASSTRFRARRKDPDQDHTQTFHMELELRSVKSRRNAVLSWTRYRVARRDVWTHFDLTPKSFPPFAFSRVKAYTREALAPL